MPPRINNETQAAGTGYQDVFNGPADHTGICKVDVTALDTDLVDSGGYLKPGAMFALNGTPVSGVEATKYVNPEAIKVAESNSAADLDAGLTAHPIAMVTRGQVVRDAVEYNLGRAMTAAEIAGFDLVSSQLSLLQ
jgi:hypothetical protein